MGRAYDRGQENFQRTGHGQAHGGRQQHAGANPARAGDVAEPVEQVPQRRGGRSFGVGLG